MDSSKIYTATGKATEGTSGEIARAKARMAAVKDAALQISGVKRDPNKQYKAHPVKSDWDPATLTYTIQFTIEETGSSSNEQLNTPVQQNTPTQQKEQEQDTVKGEVIDFQIPDKLLNITEQMLAASTREAVLAALMDEYKKYEQQIEAYANSLRKSYPANTVDYSLDQARQQLGQVYNRQVDEITNYYLDKQNNNGATTPTPKDDNKSNQKQNFYDNRQRELRNTPGYQHYVTETDKTLNGILDSVVYKKYYSDTSAELYFNGHWLEDVNAVQWQVQRQTYPLFGYNSYIYDDVALGNRIIYGAFTINFTEPDKLRKVIAQNKIEAQANTDTISYEEYAKKANTTKVTIDGKETILEGNDAHATIWSPRFDIDIVFGESNPLGEAVILPKHIILWDCHLMGSQIMTSTNDGVLQESYQFLARDFKVIK